MTRSRRIYPLAGNWKRLGVATGMSVVAIGIYCFLQNRSNAMPVIGLLGLPLTLLGGYIILAALKFKIVLRQDAIEVHHVFSADKLKRDDIRGWRLQTERRNIVPTILIFPKSNRKKTLRLPKAISSDSELETWIAALPELSLQDTREDLAKTQRRRRKSRRAIFYIVLLFAIYIWSRVVAPYTPVYKLTLVTLFLMPFALLLFQRFYPAQFKIFRVRGDKIELEIFFFVPGILLFLRGLIDVSILHWGIGHVFAVAFTAVMAAVVAYVDREALKNKVIFFVFFLITLFYGYGAVIAGNVFLDHSPRQIFETQIIDKKITHGSGRSNVTQYYLTLAPWGPQPKTEELRVDYMFYRDFQPGERICMVMGEGALGLPWYHPEYCRDSL